MNEHEQYMADFMCVFATLDRWGPGSKEDSLRALADVPHSAGRILEIGCGKGIATTLLAQNTQAVITVVDNEESALTRLHERMAQVGIADRIITVCTSMTDLPFETESFDLIWCEGSAYIMGVEAALKQWRPLLEKDGVLVVSDLVWLTDTPAEAAKAFWGKDYPDMGSVVQRLEQAKAAGYQVVNNFTLSREAWDAYIKPLGQRVAELQDEMSNSQALKDIAHELEIYRDYLDQFGYQMFILKK